MKLSLVLAALLLAGCSIGQSGATQAQLDHGRALVEQNCGSCHAPGRSGESPAPEAPPFRTLSHNYRVANLEEALAEGISVGHPAMPQFQFSPHDVDAIIAYLNSVQEPARRDAVTRHQ